MLTPDEIIAILDLKPLSIEGGYYRETYRSSETVSRHALHPRYTSDKNFCTAIYYLLTPDTFSELHRLPSDEIFHFYLGDPVMMLLLHPDGSSSVVTLGTDIIHGQIPQYIVPAGTWLGMLLPPDGNFALMGTTVSPGFDFSDYESPSLPSLLQNYPSRSDLIKRLVHTHHSGCTGEREKIGRKDPTS